MFHHLMNKSKTSGDKKSSNLNHCSITSLFLGIRPTFCYFQTLLKLDFSRQLLYTDKESFNKLQSSTSIEAQPN